MPGIASAATAVLMAHIAAGTSTIRVGAGGIMLPNHAPLMVAEAFGTLAALHGPRIVTHWVDGPEPAELPGRLMLWRERLARLRHAL